MSHAAKDRGQIDWAASRYQECCAGLTSANFISLVQAFFNCVSNLDKPKHDDPNALTVQADAWTYNADLAASVQPAVDFHNSRHQPRFAEMDAALLETAFCVAIMTRDKKHTQGKPNSLPRRVDENMSAIIDLWTKLWGAEASVRQIEVTLVFVDNGVPRSRLSSLLTCVFDCARTIRQQVEHTATPSYYEQDEYVANLKQAFRGQFHERRDGYGLSALDNLNLNLRLNLFLSHYSKIVLRETAGSTEDAGLPFYPYIALVQSSGAGKSRLLREVGRTLPLVYANLNHPESTGYPLPNRSLREFLLFAHDPKMRLVDVNSQICECWYEELVTVATITFYLLFSHRGDERKRILLPDSHALRQPVRDEGWIPVGICEPDASGKGTDNDLFWEAVTNVSRKLLNDDNLRPFEDHSASLVQLEADLRSLGQRMNSPRGQQHKNTSRDTPGTRQCSAQTGSGPVDDRNGPKPSFKEVADLILKYIMMRRRAEKESLQQMAKSLQTDGLCNVSEASALHALFIALDESRCLTQNVVKSSRYMPPDETTEEKISLFRCLRRVVHEMGKRHGICVFILFSDTTANLANFVPQRCSDPSARFMMNGGFHDAPGQPHAPFLDLRTERAGLLLVPKHICDFRTRLENFCRRWQKPGTEEEIDSVSGELTSIPFYILNEPTKNCDQTTKGNRATDADALMTDRCDSNDTGITEEREGEAIFQCNEDYVYLGRPLWASSFVRNQTKASWKEIVIFALKKLLGGSMGMSSDRATYGRQALAALACRVPLRFAECSGIAPQLIAEHMAWCKAVSWDRESVYLDYINEPILATAAAVLWGKELHNMLVHLTATCGSYMSCKGELGETAACILLIVAVDRAYANKSENETSQRDTDHTKQVATVCQSKQSSSRQTVGKDTSPEKKRYVDHIKNLPRGLSMHGVVTVRDFLESAFYLTAVSDHSVGTLHVIANREHRLKGHAWVPKPDDDRKPGSRERFRAFVPDLIANAEMRFKSIKKASNTVGCRDLPFLFEANVAVLLKSGQKGIDILIPLRLRVPHDDGRKETTWSCLAVQVKNRKENTAVYRVAGEKLNPVSTNAVRCDARDGELCPRCIFVNDNHLGLILNVHRGKEVVAERTFGGVWTFVSREAIERKDRECRKGKKRKLSGEEHAERVERQTNPRAPTSVTLIINGLLGDKSERHRSRCPLEILRQVENLLSQDTLLGVMRTRTQKQVSALDKLIKHASPIDYNYEKLHRTVDIAKQRAHDMQAVFESGT